MLSDDRPTDPAWLPIFSKKGALYGKCVWNDPRLGTGRMEQLRLPRLCHYGNGGLRIFIEGYTACCGAAL